LATTDHPIGNTPWHDGPQKWYCIQFVYTLRYLSLGTLSEPPERKRC